MCYSISSGVQLTVGEMGSLEGYCHSVGCPLDLGFKQVMNAMNRREFGLSVVPLGKQSSPICIAQSLQPGDALIGIFDNGCQEIVEVIQHAGRSCWIEEVDVVSQRCLQSIWVLAHR